MTKLETRIWVPASIDDVWSFFSNPRNLSQLTPAYLRPEVESESNIRDDATVVVHLRPWVYPLGIKWVSKIHEVQATGNERKFIDVQASGPFAYWKHTHTFSAGTQEVKSAAGKTVQCANGGTWIVDEVEYALPLGVVGKIADQIFNRRQIQSIFSYRQDILRKEFETDGA
jgi:ligand-binding SRPBCC domain-containing protein